MSWQWSEENYNIYVMIFEPLRMEEFVWFFAAYKVE